MITGVLDRIFLFAFLLLLQIALQSLSAQQIFFTESFESTAGDYTAGTGGDCGCVTADSPSHDGVFNVVTTFEDHDPAAGTSQFWASGRIRCSECGVPPTFCLSMIIDIQGRTGLAILGHFGANETTYEAGDFMEVSYRVDGGSFVSALDWRRNSSGNGVSLDTDGDGIGNGTQSLDEGSMSFPALAFVGTTGNLLEIRVCTFTDDRNEGFAFDHIQVVGTPLLPVELVHFAVERSPNRGQELTWTTNTEIDNYGFEIEFSTDATNWTMLDFMEGEGSHEQGSEYRYLDQQYRYATTSYYRLKQVDYDGTFQYSEIVALDPEIPQSTIRAFPNPSYGELNLEIDHLMGRKPTLRLINSLGEILWMKTLQGNHRGRLQFTLDSLPPGNYYLVNEYGGRIEAEKVLVF